MCGIWWCLIKFQLIQSIVIYVTTARSATLGKFSMKMYRCRAQGDGDDSLLTEIFKSERLSSYPELLLQAQPVVGSPGVVKPLQMALQRAHI